MKKDLLERLEEYCGADYVPLHMPGAKRNTQEFVMPNPYAVDITEIDGFDNMHHAEDILKEAFERTAKLFGAEESLWLINGSSAGLLAAICGATKKNDTVLVARNCHRAVYNAIYLNELNPVYLYPKEVTSGIYGAVSPSQVEQAFKQHENIRAVIITSPTYEGIVSDVKKIAEIVHRYGKILIVDEAHGAHFAFHEAFPESAVFCGADAVIQSIHKTLPSLTQTALLHLQGNIDKERVRRYWDMVQTTSPTHVLMGGIDRCMTVLETKGKPLFNAYVTRLLALRKKLETLTNIRLFPTDDISKIVLLVRDGKKLYQELLNKYHIQLEMASLQYVIAMTSIGDTDEYYERFFEALRQIDDEMQTKIRRGQKSQLQTEQDIKQMNELPTELENVEKITAFMECFPEVKCNPYDAQNGDAEPVELDLCVGRTAAAGVCFYPPGIPLIQAGEVYTGEIAEIIREGIQKNLEVIGIEKSEKGVYVSCLKSYF